MVYIYLNISLNSRKTRTPVYKQRSESDDRFVTKRHASDAHLYTAVIRARENTPPVTVTPKLAAKRVENEEEVMRVRARENAPPILVTSKLAAKRVENEEEATGVGVSDHAPRSTEREPREKKFLPLNDLVDRAPGYLFTYLLILV